MRISIFASILIGLLVGIMAIPMLMIPIMGIGVVGAALYLLIHDVIWPAIHDHNHNPEHSH